MRKIFTLILLLVSAFALIACEDQGLDTTIASPQNVAINGGVVTWDAVPQAEGYTVVVGTRRFSTALTTFDLTNENILVGTHPVFVVTVVGSNLSAPSTSLSYTVVGANSEVVLNSVIAAINSEYASDLTEDDFDDEWEYEVYQDMLRMSTTYSTAAVTVGMSETEAIGFFDDFYEMTNSMEDIDNVTGFMTELEMFEDNSVSPYAMAYIIYEMAQLALEIQIEDLEDRIAYYSDELINFLTLLDTLKASSEYIAAKAEFMSYTTPSNEDLAEEFLSAENSDLYYLVWEIEYIADEIYYYGYSDYAMWFEDDEYIMMLIDVLMAAYDADDMDFINDIRFDGVSNLRNIYSEQSNYSWRSEEIESAENNILQINETLTSLNDNETLVIESLEVVIDFLMTFKDAIPQNVITLFDDYVENGELTMAEYFIIKDSIVDILIDTLPSADDFALLHRAIFYISGAMYDIDMTSYVVHADFLGELDYAYLDLFLTMVADMNQQTFEEIITIAEQVQTKEVEFYDPWEDEYYYYYTTNYDKVIELAVAVLTYVDGFEAANQAKVDALSALMDDDAMEDLFALAIEQVKSQIVNDSWMDTEQIVLITNMLDDIVADYANIKAGLEVFEEIGVEFIDKFIATEGAMFMKLFEMRNIEDDPQLGIQTLEELITLFAEYNTIFVDGMPQADIQLVLRMFKVPVLFALEQQYPEEDYSATFDTLLPHVATVIFNILTIEKQVVSVVNTMDLENILFTQTYENEDMASIAALIQGIDLVLTTNIETLMRQTVTVIIDNILKNADLMELHGMSLLDLNDQKIVINDLFDEMFVEIHAVADLDFTDLTIAEEERVYDLLEALESFLMFGLYTSSFE